MRVGDGTLVMKPHGDTIGVALGGGRVPFNTMDELNDAGYDIRATHVVPPRVIDAMPMRVGDGTLVMKPRGDTIGVALGGGWVPFNTMDELTSSYPGKHWYVVPPRVIDAMPMKMGDGVLVMKPGGDTIGIVLGGGWVPFNTMDELYQAGYGNNTIYKAPPRVIDAMPMKVGDGTLINLPGSSVVWKVQAGHRIRATEPGKVWTVPPRVMNSIPEA